MPIGEKELKKVKDDKLRIDEFLGGEKNSERPYYSSKELSERINLDALTVFEIENYLNNSSSDFPCHFIKKTYGGTNYYKYCLVSLSLQ